MLRRGVLRIACTIGPVESGLLPELGRRFGARSGIRVEYEALGSGAALEFFMLEYPYTDSPEPNAF